MKKQLLSIILTITVVFAYAQVPANDDIANAIDVTASITFSAVNTQNATSATVDDPVGGCPVGGFTKVYYKHTPTADGNIIANVVTPGGATQNPFAIWFTAANPNATTNAELTLSPENGCTFGPLGAIPTIAGQTYYILISNPDNATDIQFVVGDFQVPANDTILTAIDITTDINGGTATYTDPNVDLRGATGASGGGMLGCDLGTTGRIYYKFTPAFDGALTVSVDTPENGALGITYSAADLNQTADTGLTLAPTDTCTFGATRTINLIGGTSYYTVISNPLGVSDITFSYGAVVPVPPNDELINAIDITSNNFVDSGVTFTAATTGSGDGGQTGCDTVGIAKVYYTFTAGSDGSVTSTINSPSGTSLILYFTSTNANPTMDIDLDAFIAGQSGCAVSSQETIDVVSGTTYYILVGNGQTSDVTFAGTNTTLSTDDFSLNNSFSLYPNPVKDVLNIQGNGLNSIELFNVSGQLIIKKSISESNVIDVKELNSGIYFIKVKSLSGKESVKKFVKN